MKFKVGDIIEPIGNERYKITKKSNNYIGEIIGVYENSHTIKVKTLECNKGERGTVFKVDSRYFCKTNSLISEIEKHYDI